MICTKCGRETSGNYCNYCGEPLNTEDTSFVNEEWEGGAPSDWLDEDYEYIEAERQGGLHSRKRSADSENAAVNRRQSRKKGKEKAKVKKVVKKEKVIEREGRKEKKRREGRESRLRQRENRREDVLSRRRSRELTRSDGADGQGLGDVAAKGAAGVIVLTSRIMQFFCCFLMAYMVFIMSGAFLKNSEGLGFIQTMVTERNYGLALYVGFAAVTLIMGVLWCLWILTRKAGGGQIRLKTYDTGRGFIPFLICAGAVLLTGPGLMLVTAEAESLGEAAKGIEAALKAVSLHRGSLLFNSMLGAGLSFVRKILRV